MSTLCVCLNQMGLLSSSFFFFYKVVWDCGCIAKHWNNEGSTTTIVPNKTGQKNKGVLTPGICKCAGCAWVCVCILYILYLLRAHYYAIGIHWRCVARKFGQHYSTCVTSVCTTRQNLKESICAWKATAWKVWKQRQVSCTGLSPGPPYTSVLRGVQFHDLMKGRDRLWSNQEWSSGSKDPGKQRWKNWGMQI